MGKELRRMNYFNGLLLDAEYYNQDKEYQRRLQGLHNRYLHTWGIISGLEVKPVPDSNMEVYVTEGAALDLTTEGLDGSEVKEIISRQIIMYEGHPENPIDLSEYNAGENIYIYLSYFESNADWDSEKGQGQEIHIWECGKLHFSTVKPVDIKKNILLARVVPIEVYDEKTKIRETIIDNSCIFDTDTDGTPLRLYAGAFGSEMKLDKFTFDMGIDLEKTPVIQASVKVLKSDYNQELDNEQESNSNQESDTEEESDSNQDSDIEMKSNTNQAPDTEDGSDSNQDSGTEQESDSNQESDTEEESDPYQDSDTEQESDPNKKTVTVLEFFPNQKAAEKSKEESDEESDEESESNSEQEPKENQSTYPFVKFKGSVSINDDLDYTGKLVSKNNKGEINPEFTFKENFLQLNSKDEDEESENENESNDGSENGNESKKKGSIKWGGPKDGGMDVYRGGNGVPDARILWSEVEQIWKAGLENSLSPLAYGDKYENLKNSAIAGELHQHNILYSNKGISISADMDKELSINRELILNDNNIECSKGQVAWYGGSKLFDKTNVDGCVLLGNTGGLLGTTYEGQKAVLSWNNKGKNGRVGIGSVDFSKSDDDVNIAGSTRILIGTNPLRITSQWTAFPDKTINQAEICNDTTYHKALMIVGNQSAGQGRKVAIWDWLDVNGFLYVNGNMQVSNKLRLSEGTGNNGIIFPNDPGGGSGDSAWIKYYPKILEGGKKVESCTLEIGTSNDSDDNIYLNSSGNVGISSSNFIPNEKLDVEGYTRILSGSNSIRFTSSWSGFTSKSPLYAEICNDTGIYKSLMIAGNRSGGYERRVSMWDDVDVNGDLRVDSNIKVEGAIIPGVGECEVNGIMFDKNPGGGSGDAAWIRYYSDKLRGGGENMTLEIGISNDSNIYTETGRYWVSNCPYPWVTNPCGSWKYYTRTIVGNGGDRLLLKSPGGIYVDGNFYITSSKEYKENIHELSQKEAQNAIEALEPVEYNFKGDKKKTTIGFIAENVPDSLASYNKTAISPMEIIAVLVKEVKDQERAINELDKKIIKISKNKRKKNKN